MNFKHYNRVEYEKNTLFEVVFQARFPKILKIHTEEPVTFQERVRKIYPVLEKDTPQLSVVFPEEVRKALSSKLLYRFQSEDGNWQISIASDFVSFACLKTYSNYNDYRERLEQVLINFHETYRPAYFTRIGLRYRNIINKVVLENDDINIRDCIPTHIAPELKEPIKGDVKQFEKIVVFNDNGNKVNLTHTLLELSGTYGRHHINCEETYCIDIDCYSDQKTRGVNDAISKSRIFNRNVRNIFRWSITEMLHQAMGPKTD